MLQHWDLNSGQLTYTPALRLLKASCYSVCVCGGEYNSYLCTLALLSVGRLTRVRSAATLVSTCISRAFLDDRGYSHLTHSVSTYTTTCKATAYVDSTRHRHIAALPLFVCDGRVQEQLPHGSEEPLFAGDQEVLHPLLDMVVPREHDGLQECQNFTNYLVIWVREKRNHLVQEREEVIRLVRNIHNSAM